MDPEKKKKIDQEKKKKTDPEKKTHNNESMQSEIQKEKQMVQHLEWMNCTPKRLEKTRGHQNLKPLQIKEMDNKGIQHLI
jgi:hypothetical protein